MRPIVLQRGEKEGGGGGGGARGGGGRRRRKKKKKGGAINLGTEKWGGGGRERERERERERAKQWERRGRQAESTWVSQLSRRTVRLSESTEEKEKPAERPCD